MSDEINKYTNRQGERCSEACGQGRHAECTETYDTCHCTYRGLHKTMHVYATIESVPSGGEQCPTCGSDSFRNIPWCYCPAIPLPHSADFTPQCKPCPDPWHDPTPAAQPDQPTLSEMMRYHKENLGPVVRPRKITFPDGSVTRLNYVEVSAEATKPQCPTCGSCKRKERYGVIALGVCEYCHGHKQIAPHILDDQDCPVCKATGVKLCRDSWHDQPEWVPVRDVWDAKRVEEVAAVPPTQDLSAQERLAGLFGAVAQCLGYHLADGAKRYGYTSRTRLGDAFENGYLFAEQERQIFLAPSQVKAEGAELLQFANGVADAILNLPGLYRDDIRLRYFIAERLEAYAASRLVEKQAEISRLTQERDEADKVQLVFRKLNEKLNVLVRSERSAKQELEAANASLKQKISDEIERNTGPTGGWLCSPKKLLAALAKGDQP